MNNETSASTGYGGRKPLGPIVFRCDANVQTGLGHASRCLGLAEAFEDIGCTCIFSGEYSGAARVLLDGARMPCENLPALTKDGGIAESLRLIESTGAGIVVVDNYDISQDHLNAIYRRGVPIVLIDDFARFASYPCSVLLNFTVNAAQLPYPRTRPHRLLGPRYFLARRRLRWLRSQPRRNQTKVERIFIAIGGTDRHHLALRLIETLATVAPGLIVRVAAGLDGVQEISGKLESFAPGSGAFASQPDLVDEFATADACISGGGLLKYESAYLGLPVAVLSQTREQAAETIEFAGRRLAFDLGYGPQSTPWQLAHGLREFLENDELKAVLTATGRETFPPDSTVEAARGILEYLDNDASPPKQGSAKCGHETVAGDYHSER